MYKATIKTKYNVINMTIEDINSKEFLEICEQPYVLEVRAEKIKQLEKERDEALSHCVGMAYYNDLAQEKTKMIRQLKKEY